MDPHILVINPNSTEAVTKSIDAALAHGGRPGHRLRYLG